MKIDVHNRQSILKFRPAAVRQIVKTVLEIEEIECEEVAVHLISTAEICRLHEVYFNDPSTTDTISFPLNSQLLGDVFVCPETAVDYSKTHSTDPYEETALYIIHGLLHLLGYDDLNPKDRRLMRAAEKRALHAIKDIAWKGKIQKAKGKK